MTQNELPKKLVNYEYYAIIIATKTRIGKRCSYNSYVARQLYAKLYICIALHSICSW